MNKGGRLAPVWSKLTDLEVVSGFGATVSTADGAEYLDLTSGIAVTSTGHCHPKVVEAIREQAGRFLHAQVNVYTHDLLQPLADKLAELTPDGLDTFFFSNSGAEATEGAVKLARQATKKPNIIVFQGSFHGRTAQTMAMTTSKTSYRAGHAPLPSGIFVAQSPQFSEGGTVDDAVEAALHHLDYLLSAQTAPSETAAMVIEPVQGEGGYYPMPPAFLRGVAERCKELGILLIADEVQCGFGRTGAFFAVEHYGIVPDIMIMAKGLGSGFPISGLAASYDLMSLWPVGSHGGTYGGNPMGCAAALATIEVISADGFLAEVSARGAQLMEGLREIARHDRSLGDVRGLGLMVGSAIVEPETGRPDGARVSAMLSHALEDSKVIFMNCGTWGNVLRWMPPLVVSEAQIGQGLAAFEAALKATAR